MIRIRMMMRIKVNNRHPHHVSVKTIKELFAVDDVRE